MMASTLRTLETVESLPGTSAVTRWLRARRTNRFGSLAVTAASIRPRAASHRLRTSSISRPFSRGEPARWHKIEAEGFSPWARAFGCLVSMPRPSPYLYLFGGGDGNIDFDDVYALNVGTSYWERITNVTGDKGPRSQAGCSLLPLRRRGGASASGHPSFALALHGGYGGPRGNVSQHARLSSARGC